MKYLLKKFHFKYCLALFAVRPIPVSTPRISKLLSNLNAVASKVQLFVSLLTILLFVLAKPVRRKINLDSLKLEQLALAEEGQDEQDLC